MTTPPENISVTLPVTQAIERVKLLLFRPFDFGKWFTIGFCAWLAHLGQTGFNANFNVGQSHQGKIDIHEQLSHTWAYVLANLAWILPLLVAVIFTILALGTLMLWLRSHGSFMFLHCVALNKAEISAPWNKFFREGNSLFLFRLGLWFISLIPLLPLAALLVVLIIRMAGQGWPNIPDMLAVFVVGMALFSVGMVFLVIAKLTEDFVVPIMFLRGTTCFEGWKELLGLFSGRLPVFLLYLLFQFVLNLATGIIVLAAIIITCCIACCVIMLPYLGAVLLLPILVFKRSYSLHYLAQFGRDYDVFPFLEPPPLPGTVPPEINGVRT